jgi:gamma-glutamyltranspeptidase / glutathione hydrolase
MFTTRPEIKGTFGVVTSTHWLASAAGMAMLEKGGNAFDACAAAGFVLQIVEPHLVGPGGDLPVIFYSARTKKVEVICGQGPTPAGATMAHYKAQGLDLVPGSGMLATVIPGAFDGWMLMLKDHGKLPLRTVLEPAIHYALNGHPMLPRVADQIASLGEMFAKEWPTSYATWWPGGKAPKANALFKNPALAKTYLRILKEAEAAGGGRVKQIKRARKVWAEGFVAEAIDRFVRKTEVLDSSGQRNKGVLTGQDMANWRASYEAPASVKYHGFEVFKAGAWSQGPLFLQTLKILESFDIKAMGPKSTAFVHTVSEALKLAFADREAYYGDPEHVDVPLATLLSDTYAAQRRKLIGDSASLEQRPGKVKGFETQVAATLKELRIAGQGVTRPLNATVGEPTLQSMTAASRRGDTVHIDVIDNEGNMVTATPSGGWLQSSPTIPKLGFQLNSRAQMFWLTDGLPGSLAPGKRPRTTLTPTLAFEGGDPRLVFGTPGGDQQEQWQMVMFLRRAHHGLNLQEAIDLPMFHTAHGQSSFYPREAKPGHLCVEESIGADVLSALAAKGHLIEKAPPWTVGRVTAAEKDADGMLRAAATPRLMQAYAVGR